MKLLESINKKQVDNYTAMADRQLIKLIYRFLQSNA